MNKTILNMDFDWNKKFFGKSYDPEEENEEGYDDIRQEEDIAREAEMEGYNKGLADGIYRGYQEGYLEGAKDKNEEWEKENKKAAWKSGALMFVLGTGLYCLGMFVERKWGKK